MSFTENYVGDAIDRAMMDHKRQQSRVESLKGDLGLIFAEEEAQKVATETISVIEQNPRALFEAETLVEWIENRFNVDLDALIQQAIHIQAMHKPQKFDDMTFDANDIRKISDFVVKRVQQETGSDDEAEVAQMTRLRQKAQDLQQELESVNAEIEEMQQRIRHLTQSKMNDVMRYNHEMNGIRAEIAEYGQKYRKGNVWRCGLHRNGKQSKYRYLSFDFGFHLILKGYKLQIYGLIGCLRAVR